MTSAACEKKRVTSVELRLTHHSPLGTNHWVPLRHCHFMRYAFVTTLLKLAGRDERILLLTGDLGYTVLEPFAEKFPYRSDLRRNRFFNVGVAEQNMVGMGTGLAEAGTSPFSIRLQPLPRFDLTSSYATVPHYISCRCESWVSAVVLNTVQQDQRTGHWKILR